jgi:hypothetical protein
MLRIRIKSHGSDSVGCLSTSQRETSQCLAPQTGILIAMWRSSFNCIYIVGVLLYGAGKTGKPLTVRGEILQTLLVKKSARSI